MVDTKEHIAIEEVWKILESVPDPEIPVISIVELGVVRDVKRIEDSIDIIITPTYTGCPAMDMISVMIKAALEDHKITNYQLKTILTPPWTTDWMSAETKDKLKAYGIAPPAENTQDKNSILGHSITVACPQCDSSNTVMLSQFGSTPCKSLYKCNDCLEPFDYFKCH